MLWASLAFTLMATFSRWAGDYCDWRLIAAARATVACVFAFLLAKFVGAKLVFWKPRILWVRSLAGTFATSSIGSTKVKKALNAPRNAASGSRAMLKKL